MNSTATFDPEAASLQDWLAISRNAAKVPASDPRYPEARAVWNEAYRRITVANAQAHAKDIQDMQQAANTGVLGLGKGEGAIESGLVGFGHGASLGLAGEPNYMAAANATHPAATTIGDLAGTGATAALLGAGLGPGLSIAGQGALGGGLAGGGRGAVEAQPGQRVTGALAGGAIGAATGYASGKILGKIVGLLNRGGNAALGKLTGDFGPSGGVAGNPPTPNGGGGSTPELAQATIQREMEAGRPAPTPSTLPADIQQAIADHAAGKISDEDLGVAIKQATGQPLGQVRTGAGGATTTLPPKMEPIEGTGGRGFTAEGKATPPIPTTPTIREIVTGVSSRLDNPTTPAEQVATAVRAARDQVRRALSPQEVEAIASKNLSGLGRGQTLPYYSRGGATAETIIPGQQSPKVPEAIDWTKPGSIADALQTHGQLARSLGQQVTPEQLQRFLGRLDAKTLAAVHNELLARAPK